MKAGYRRAIFHGLVLAGLIFFAYTFLVSAANVRTFGYDAYAYWSIDLDQLYGGTYGSLGFFAYSPAFALAMLPFTLLSWHMFLVVWIAILFASIVWLGGRSFLTLLAFPPVAIELYHGNIHILLAVALVLGFRYPAAWAFVLLTKVAPGVGLLWFVVRREWRSLAIAVGVTAVISVASMLLLPAQWADWFDQTISNAGTNTGWPALPVPLWLRLPVAAAIVIWGARRDARWTVPLAATLALPVLWVGGLAMLVGGWPLRPGRDPRESWLPPPHTESQPA